MHALWVKKVARLASRAIEQFIVIGCPICGCFDDVFAQMPGPLLAAALQLWTDPLLVHLHCKWQAWGARSANKNNTGWQHGLDRHRDVHLLHKDVMAG